jgi:hypothetical protein
MFAESVTFEGALSHLLSAAFSKVGTTSALVSRMDTQ